MQRDQRCSGRFEFFSSETQICVGNPRERKSAFRVRKSMNTCWGFLGTRDSGLTEVSRAGLYLFKYRNQTRSERVFFFFRNNRKIHNLSYWGRWRYLDGVT